MADSSWSSTGLTTRGCRIRRSKSGSYRRRDHMDFLATVSHELRNPLNTRVALGRMIDTEEEELLVKRTAAVTARISLSS